MSRGFRDWVNHRWPLASVVHAFLTEDIPGGASLAYALGSAILIAFLIVVITGIWQVFYYVPTVDHAYDSLSYLRTQVPFGWLIHGLHYWGANAMIVLVIMHMTRVFVWGAYKNPRELTWLAGVGLLLLTFAMSFTGATLPWDERGYWATEVGASIAGTVPGIGGFLARFVRGGAVLGQLTLSRFFISHVALLPALLFGLAAIHVVALRRFGSTGPWQEEKHNIQGTFWPDQLFIDTIVSVLIFLVLVGLSAFSPAPIAGPADPLDTSYVPKPEWNFLFLYEGLRFFRGPWESVGTVAIPFLSVLLIALLPFFDRTPERAPRRRLVSISVGAALLITWIAFTVAGNTAGPTTTQSAANLPPVGSVTALSVSARRGSELFVSLGCVGCHAVQAKGGAVGPLLSLEALKGRPRSWLTTHIRNPETHYTGGIMPPYASLSDAQVNALVDYLSSLGPPSSPASGQQPPVNASLSAAISPAPAAAAGASGHGLPAGYPVSAPGPVSGSDLFVSLGCRACHKVNGTGGTIGPDLSVEGLKGRSRGWLTTKVRDPRVDAPNSTMPPYATLTDEQLSALVDYLSSLGTRGVPPTGTPTPPPATPTPPATVTPPPPTATPPPGGANVPGAGPPGPAAYLIGSTDHGAVLFAQYCEACHGIEGKGGVLGPGSGGVVVSPLKPISRALFSPDAVTFAENVDRFIQHGAEPRPNAILRMPAFGDTNSLTQQQIADIEAYVLGINGVNRAELVHPGIAPERFFAIMAIAIGLAGVGLWVAWLRMQSARPPLVGGKRLGRD